MERDAEKDLALLADFMRDDDAEISRADIAMDIAPYWIKRAQELEQKLRGAKKTLEKQGRQIKRLKEALADSVVAECMSEQGIEIAKLKQENKEMNQEIEVLHEALRIVCLDIASRQPDEPADSIVNMCIQLAIWKARKNLGLPHEPVPAGEISEALRVMTGVLARGEGTE